MKYEARDILRRAFLNERLKRKENWRQTNLPALKNQLLQLTNQEFNEITYGANSFIDYVKSYPDIVTINNDVSPPLVEYIESQDTNDSKSDASHKSAAISLFDGDQIRSDLWLAILDYKSGDQYSWDIESNTARKYQGGDKEVLIPTVTKELMIEWRTDFVKEISDIDEPLREKLEQWSKLELSKRHFPTYIKKRWAAYQQSKVLELLNSWLTHVKSSEDVIQSFIDSDDLQSAGEYILNDLFSIDAGDDLSSFVFSTICFSSKTKTNIHIQSIEELIERIDRFDATELAIGSLHSAWRFREVSRELPSETNDLFFKVIDKANILLPEESKQQIEQKINICITRIEDCFANLSSVVNTFKKTTPVTAKATSIELLKKLHNYVTFGTYAEKNLIREVEVLLGPIFRKFCEACEKHMPDKVQKRGDELRLHIQKLQENYDSESSSRFINRVYKPILEHVESLVEDGVSKSDSQSKPKIKLFGETIKLDIQQTSKQQVFPIRLFNDGLSKAYSLNIKSMPNVYNAEIGNSGSEHFDLAPGQERQISVILKNYDPSKRMLIPLSVSCTTSNGRSIKFDFEINLLQQNKQPDWETLKSNPPYGTRPIKKRTELFGRDSILDDLILSTTSRDSTFLWGTKRIGKTSILQVLASEIKRQENIICLIFRMGELTSMHEGQLAHTIAYRICEKFNGDLKLPAEGEFGAGMSKLVPFIESFSEDNPDYRITIIIDEFDDLDPTFYTGERGNQFIKALRSLSEVGLTFFFVGSERMETIYKDHETYLNKWVNKRLDHLDSFEDCKSLITIPVINEIEYEEDAVKEIAKYCNGNPFYMHLICSSIFKLCWQEKRTFVSSSYVEITKKQLLKSLSKANFAHFWEDNPALSLDEKQKQSAQNCHFLTCVSLLGGSYESIDDILEAQESLNLSPKQLLTKSDLRDIESRLIRRGVISRNLDNNNYIEVVLPIFKEWLADNAESQILPIWIDYCESLAIENKEVNQPTTIVLQDSFPIHEDDLLEISEKLLVFEKQIDVAEIKKWLRQFDDDNRIEIAYLLLKRLAEKGFVDNGKYINALSTMKEIINDKRLNIEKGSWTIIRSRLDNLCITYVDSDIKSGATTARELGKRMSPGRNGPLTEIDSWIKSHIDSDPIVVLVDDFSGTGKTLITGIKKAWDKDPELFSKLAKEKRFFCCVQNAFQQAINSINDEYPDIDVIVPNVFGQDLLSIDPDAEIFESKDELIFAKDMLLQIGRELNKNNPLGFGQMGALVAFHNTTPNNTLPIFWCNGKVNNKEWKPLLPRY